MADSFYPALFAPRDPSTHKGSFGTLAVIGGGPGMTGAALLAARAALHLGAGKVLVGFAEATPALSCDPLQPELMCRDALSVINGDFGVTAWVLGCGAGTRPYTIEAIAAVLRTRGAAPLVIDADALNLIAAGSLEPEWGTEGPVVMTPHPAEAARLLACSASDIQNDRAGAARRLAQRFDAWIVLKGAGTVMSDPQGSLSVNTSGNPGLATAGTGDVLAGMLGSLIAQGVPLDQAIRGGVWLHGASADACVDAGTGPIGLTAGELAVHARWLRNHPDQAYAREQRRMEGVQGQSREQKSNE